MFGGKKEKKKKLVSCPFCFGEFEDVTAHLNECSANTSNNTGSAVDRARAPLSVAASAPSLAVNNNLHKRASTGRTAGRSPGWVSRKAPSTNPRRATENNTTRATIEGQQWEKVLDPAGSGEYYYWNRTTNETQWTPPEGYPTATQPQPMPVSSASLATVVRSTPERDITGGSPARDDAPLDRSASAVLSPRSSSSSNFKSLRSKKNKMDQNISITREDSDSFQMGGEALSDEDQRTKIAHEILSTERYYIECLELLMQHYYEPLMKLARLNRNTDISDVDITLEQVDKMFGNMGVLIPINVNLRDALAERLDEWNDQTVIGDVFLRMAPFLKMYGEYGLNYHEATALLDQFNKKENFVSYIDSCFSKTDINVRLEGLLIMPVQRIPRYVLLLKEIRKHTPADHPDTVHLDQAIPVIEEVAAYLNRNITEYENQRKFMALSEQGAADLVRPHRTLNFEGLLMDMRKKSKFHIWIFNDLVIHLSETKAKNKANLVLPKHQWPMHLVWLAPAAKRLDTFILTGPNHEYEFRASSPEECSKWVTIIQKSLGKHMERISKLQDPTLEKEKDANMTPDAPKRYGTYTFPTNDTYSGWWNNGQMEGEGEYSHLGSVYTGEFVAGQKNGKGTLKYITGDVYDGMWKANLPNGQGTLSYLNGDVFTGLWKDGKKNGRGELKTTRGCLYSGEWKDDFPDGLGDLTTCDGISYTGNWLRGQRNHYGLWTCSKTGRRYEGNWDAGVRSGKGRLEYGDGTVYDGFWKDGLRNGQGVYTDPLEGTYEGSWVADRPEGKGIFKYSDGREYNGSWSKGTYNGVGVLSLNKGMIVSYSGDWLNGLRHGKGKMVLRNGDTYEGHFKDGLMHGSGTLIYANNMKLDSKWITGKPCGKCTLFRATGKKSKDKKDSSYSGICRNGIIHSPDGSRPSVAITYSPLMDICSQY